MDLQEVKALSLAELVLVQLELHSRCLKSKLYLSGTLLHGSTFPGHLLSPFLSSTVPVSYVKSSKPPALSLNMPCAFTELADDASSVTGSPPLSASSVYSLNQTWCCLSLSNCSSLLSGNLIQFNFWLKAKTALGASEFIRELAHPTRVHTAAKRYFLPLNKQSVKK